MKDFFEISLFASNFCKSFTKSNFASFFHARCLNFPCFIKTILAACMHACILHVWSSRLSRVDFLVKDSELFQRNSALNNSETALNSADYYKIAKALLALICSGTSTRGTIQLNSAFRVPFTAPSPSDKWSDYFWLITFLRRFSFKPNPISIRAIFVIELHHFSTK